MTPEQQQDIQIRLNCLSLATQAFHLQPEKITETAYEFYLYAIGYQNKDIVHAVTSEDLKNNPSLKSQGIKKGDTISIPQEN